MRTTYLIVLALATTSCTSSLNLDRFEKQQSQAVDSANVTYFDFVFTAKDMQSHLNEYMEWRLVDKSNAVQGKGVIINVPRPDFKIEFARFIPKANGPYRIDWWADHNDSGAYDGIVGGINMKDHAWRRVLSDPLPDDVTLSGTRYTLDFVHDTAFVDIATDLEGNKIPFTDTLLPLKLGIKGADAYVGKDIEVRVVDKGAGRLVAVHRAGRAIASYLAVVTGVLDEQTTYEVSIYVDLNDDDAYTSGEPSWKTDMTSTANGIESDFDLSASPQAPIEELQ